MKYIIKYLNKWANAHTNIAFDFVRIALGAYLFFKGVYFFEHTEAFMDILNPKERMGVSLLIAHYVAMAHLIGGLMIVCGFLTRIAALFQLPILIGAVAINFINYMVYESLVESVIVLLFTVAFTIIGSGKHSADYSMQLEI